MANKKVRVAIIGAGNCASSFVQGLYYYKNAKPEDRIPGVMHVDLGGYHISDIEIVAAFDVVDTKVGLDLSEALFAFPNNTYKFCDIPKMGVKVHRGMTHDGLGTYLSQILKSPRPYGRHRRHSPKRSPMYSSITCPLVRRWPPNGIWSRHSKPG